MSKSKTTMNGSMPYTSSPTDEPTSEEIAAAAHAIWEQEGRPDGRELEHWLKAEAVMRAARTHVE
jgi:hypothetical protein